MRKIIAVLSVIVLFLGVGRGRNISAQGSNCGNGLAPRLTVGMTGRVIPEPPQPVNVRETPGGRLIGALQPANTFTVLDGPECKQNYSWWQVTGQNNVRGWIVEGTSYYFIEPVAPASAPTAMGGHSGADNPAFAQVGVCADAPPTRLRPGMIAQATQTIDSFMGEPLIANAFFPTYVDPTFVNRSYPNLPPKAGDLWFVRTGPVCISGINYWQVVKVKSLPFSLDDVYVGIDQDMSILQWVGENLGQNYNLEPLPQQIMPKPQFTPAKLRLLPGNAPLLAPSLQLAFSSQGGGEGQTPGWYEECDITPLEYFDKHCIDIYPFPVGEAVEVTIKEPDGTVFSHDSLTAQPVTAFYLPDYGAERKAYPFGAVRIFPPTNFGLPTGAWTVEAQDQTTKIAQSYLLLPDTSKAALLSRCDGVRPVLYLTGFSENAPAELVLVAPKDYNDDPNQVTQSGGHAEFTANLQELDRWKVMTGSRGELVIYPGYIPPVGFFVATTADGDWRSRIPLQIYNYDTGQFAQNSQWSCAPFTSSDGAASDKIAYNTLVGGNISSNQPDAFYAFDGQAGDNVIVEVLAVHTPEEPYDKAEFSGNIRVETSNGTVIAESDNEATSSSSDSSIHNFVLPETGSYTMVISWPAQEYAHNQFVLFLKGPLSSNAHDNRLSYNVEISAVFPDQAEWTFSAHAGDDIQLSVQSSKFDARVQLLDGQGNVLADNDDSADNMNPNLEYEIAVDGDYTVVVSSWNNKGGPYTLEVSR